MNENSQPASTPAPSSTATACATTAGTPCAKASKACRITGWVIAALIGLFFISGGINSILLVDMVVEGSQAVGLGPDRIPAIGVILLISTLLYLVPPTAILGAILLTGYLGGAVAMHVRADDPIINCVVPAVFGMFVWLSLYLRIKTLRRMIPIRCWKSCP